MIRFTKDESEPDWHGYFYAVLLFIAAVVQSLLLHQYFHRSYLVGMRFRTAVIVAVYRKVCEILTSTQHHTSWHFHCYEALPVTVDILHACTSR